MVTRVLVTGFGPFLDVAVNASEMLARRLGQLAWPDELEVHVLCLETSYEGARNSLKERVEALKPHGVLCLGVAKTEGLRFERRAEGVVKSQHPDTHGVSWLGRELGESSKTRLHLEALRARVGSSTDLPLSLSDDCGAYVCNALYQQALHLMDGQALFVHLDREACATETSQAAFEEALAVVVREFAWEVGRSWVPGTARVTLKPLEAEAREEGAYRLHLLSLTREAEALTPGYARQDEALRRGAGGRKKGALTLTWTHVREALAAEEAPPQERAWFGKRQAFGEKAEVERRTLKLIAETEALLAEIALPAGPMREVILALSPSLRAQPLALWQGEQVQMWCGVETPPEVLVLALLSALAWPGFTLGESLEQQRQYLLMGGSAFVAARPSEALVEHFLEVSTKEVLLPQHRGDEVERWIQNLARTLDQPPGEVERMAHGLARRRSDRLHRAWLRGFFVPRDVTPAWSIT